MRRRTNKNDGILAASPYILWSGIFIVIPILIVLFFSLTIKNGDSYVFSLDNFIRLFEGNYPKIFGKSLWLAFLTTVVCLILGYPTAYLISKMKSKKRSMLIMLFIIPMWMNFLIRTYAWLPILRKNGLINNFLEIFGIAPLNILYTDFAVILGMVYNFLPFMILPIFTVLTKIDKDLTNAASDLGANRLKVFSKVVFPLSLPGVVSGITMVFMPAVSTFVISRILGGGQYWLVGNAIETQFITIGDWNFGSAIAICMMVIILISMTVMNRIERKNSIEGGK